MIARFGVAAVAAALVLSAAPARAQSTAPANVSLFAPATQEVAAPRAPQAGPTRDAASVAVRPQVPAADRAKAADMAGSTSRSQSRAMMIVGGAGLIVGAIIGGTPGTIVMVGGAVVGLLGLYEYVQ